MNTEEIKINPPKKMGFFKRIATSIFKVENYGEFVLENTNVSIKYFLLLILLVVIITSIFSTYQMNQIFNKGLIYLKNEMPDFIYENGIIKFSEETCAYDKDLDLYIKYATKSEYSDSVLNDFEKEINNYSSSIVYLQDRFILYRNGQYLFFKYKDILDNSFNINNLNKQDLIDKIDNIGIVNIDLSYFIMESIFSYFANIIGIFFDVLLVFCFAIIASRICGVHIPASKLISISIYSLTLSILLTMIYSIVCSFTNFYIEYFRYVYFIIAYIYIISAILIIKSDVIKQKLELQKIIEVQKQVKKELKEQEDKEQEDNKEENDEEKGESKEKKEEGEDPILNREPDGSEI